MHMSLAGNKLGALGILVADRLERALGDVSPSAAALLLALFYRPDCTITALAGIAGVAQPTAVRVLDGLVKRGWVSREEKQGRTTPLALTPAGRRQAQRLQSSRMSALDSLLAGLPKADRVRFDALLDRLLAEATTSRKFARTTCRLCDHAVCDGPACPIGCRATAIELSNGVP